MRFMAVPIAAAISTEVTRTQPPMPRSFFICHHVHIPLAPRVAMAGAVISTTNAPGPWAGLAVQWCRVHSCRSVVFRSGSGAAPAGLYSDD